MDRLSRQADPRFQPAFPSARAMRAPGRRCDHEPMASEEAETEQRIRFRPSVPLPGGLLESLPDVTHVIHRGDVVVVTGNGNALNAVTSVLARNQIVARHLRVD